jgi:proteic killer suppression protein
MAVVGFKNKNLRKLFEDGTDRKIPPELRNKLLGLLDHLDSASDKSDLNIAGFHELKGDRKGTYSWSVTGNYRLTFRFEDGEAFDIDLKDYH